MATHQLVICIKLNLNVVLSTKIEGCINCVVRSELAVYVLYEYYLLFWKLLLSSELHRFRHSCVIRHIVNVHYIEVVVFLFKDSFEIFIMSIILGIVTP